MNRIKCFVIEKTDKVERVSDCNCCPARERQIWRRTDTGEEGSQWDFPAGAMYLVPWEDGYNIGEKIGGMALAVKTPGGYWNVHSRASNCTRKDDSTHNCWVIHGEVPNITVDKQGNTCQAGAGSIITHGNGYLEGC